ncbi:unnamed protein product [Cylindrotheca closterium]|uniref:RING-type domain-containing protein n=1 Tax=Cylindrotheca closterium TaxID=2856 RepID=A0AAD2JHX2_9STRA|nr:unnamed protein product [Cylindrotheca closterium]
MPVRSRSRTRTYHDCKQFCRSSSICGSFFAMIWCINMLISAVTSLGYVSKFFDEWIEADALIIGRNISVHYRNNNRSQRRLISSNIPNFAADSLLGNQSNLFDNITDGNNSLINNIDIVDDIGNTTGTGNSSTQGNDGNNVTDSNGDGDSNKDLDDTDTNSATAAPTTTPPPMEPGFGGRLVYCAEVQFQLVDDDITITAVSDTYCSYDPTDIIVGNMFGILYNPAAPQEIIEESLYSHAQNTLRLTVGVTVFFTVGYLLCSIYLWRSQPDMSRVIFPQSGRDHLNMNDGGNPNEIAQTREEREALMKTKFHFQTVLEDLSNTDAANIRRLCLNGEEDGEGNQCACQAGCGCNNKASDGGQKGKETPLHDDIEAQQEQKDDPLQGNTSKEDDMELDLTKRDNRDENSASNTEAETDTDAGSNNQGSEGTERNDTKKEAQQQQQPPQEQESAWSLAGATNLISSWTNAALAPSAPECCICLENYQPGDKICTAKSDGCDHVFHQQCIEAWLHRHDACPLCRVDLMNTNLEE